MPVWIINVHPLPSVGCHPWMETGNLWMLSMDGEMSSTDGLMLSLDESVIGGCHPWMTSTNGDDGHGRSIKQPSILYKKIKED